MESSWTSTYRSIVVMVRNLCFEWSHTHVSFLSNNATIPVPAGTILHINMIWYWLVTAAGAVVDVDRSHLVRQNWNYEWYTWWFVLESSSLFSVILTGYYSLNYSSKWLLLHIICPAKSKIKRHFTRVPLSKKRATDETQLCILPPALMSL